MTSATSSLDGISAPRHTPYDGSHPLFRIGLKPLDLADWLEVDGRIDAYLREKDELLATRRDEVLLAEPGTEDAQREVLELVVAHLRENGSEHHRFEGEDVHVAGRAVRLDAGAPPIETASRLIQEDLVLMRNGEGGWRIAAACVCFPSAWNLAEKFGKPLDMVHEHVPQFGPGSRNAGLMTRIFDNLAVDLPVWRMNWSVHADGALFHPQPGGLGDGTALPADGPWLRVEYQTLRKLAKSGDIVFTIRIHTDPISALLLLDDGARVAEGLAKSLEMLDGDQVRYKGMEKARARIAAMARAIARQANG
jgi:hypothetical protein